VTVYVLRHGYDDEYIEGVYTLEAKLKKEQEFLVEAEERRDCNIASIKKQIEEITVMRNPIIYEAEAMLADETAAKEANHTGRLKEVRKKSKTLLRQAEKMTYNIHSLESKLLNLSCLTKSQLLAEYGRCRYFEEHTLEE
jgi:hypothetical protein